MVNVALLAVIAVLTIVVLLFAFGFFLLFAYLGLYWSSVLAAILFLMLVYIRMKAHQRQEEAAGGEEAEGAGTSPETEPTADTEAGAENGG